MEWIVVLTDFSDESNNALKSAYEITLKYNHKGYTKKILLVHILDTVSEISFDFKGEHLPGNFNEKEIAVQHKNAERKLKNIMSNPTFKDVEISYRLIDGKPQEQIKDIIATGIDLIVMGQRHKVVFGTKGSSGPHELLIGEELEEFIREASCPLLMIKRHSPEFKIDNLLLSYPGCSTSNESLIAKVKELQKLFRAQIYILAIEAPNTDQRNETSNESIQEFIEHHQIEEYKVIAVQGETEEDAINKFMKENSSDIIVLPCSHASGAPGLLHGSTAEDKIYSEKTVLTIY